ncbi:MAG: chalcone isomerase family protein [Gemmatimonadales bacterium]|nr:chalcone isomerase family protein [Gemmatimonadales bacterium]
MKKFVAFPVLLTLVFLLLPLTSGAVTESKTGTEYPDEITVGQGDQSVTLVATGVGLREKTFLKVDVYTIVSYIHDQAKIEGDADQAIITLKAPKRLQMDLRRGFSRDKLINAFVEGIEANYEDLTPFATDMETFKGFFTRDAEENDKIIFHYCPAVGLTVELNGENVGVIENFEFVQALWTVWLGQKPANDGLKKNLVAEIGS